jgi:hypothetical protein
VYRGGDGDGTDAHVVEVECVACFLSMLRIAALVLQRSAGAGTSILSSIVADWRTGDATVLQ